MDIDKIIGLAMIFWLLAVVLGAGIFGMAVEIFGTDWVDNLWDKWERRKR